MPDKNIGFERLLSAFLGAEMAGQSRNCSIFLEKKYPNFVQAKNQNIYPAKTNNYDKTQRAKSWRSSGRFQHVP